MTRPPAEKKAPENDPSNSWLQVPAVYCDTFSTGLIPGNRMIRIVFGDYISRQDYPFYRSAVVMPIDDIEVLIKHLTRRVAELKKIEAEAEGAPEAEAADDELPEE